MPAGFELVANVVSRRVCCIFQVERLKSRLAFAYPLWCALNQDAHSQEASPTSRRESQVTQTYTLCRCTVNGGAIMYLEGGSTA